VASGAIPVKIIPPTAPSTPVREHQHGSRPDIWPSALSSLPAELRTSIPQTSNASFLDNIAYLQQLLAEKQKICEDRAWKFKFKDKELILRDVVGKAIESLNKFKQIET
jgi:hypothetical protein